MKTKIISLLLMMIILLIPISQSAKCNTDEHTEKVKRDISSLRKRLINIDQKITDAQFKELVKNELEESYLETAEEIIEEELNNHKSETKTRLKNELNLDTNEERSINSIIDSIKTTETFRNIDFSKESLEKTERKYQIIQEMTSDNPNIAAELTSSEEFGGDHIDIRKVDGKIILSGLDITHHGYSAAIYKEIVLNIMSELDQQNLAPKEYIQELNKRILETTSHSNFHTHVMIEVNPNKGTVDYVNAGQKAYVLSDNLERRAIESETPVIGAIPSSLYNKEITQQSQPIKAGDKVVLMSDGIHESFKGKQQFQHVGLSSWDSGTTNDLGETITRTEISTGKYSFRITNSESNFIETPDAVEAFLIFNRHMSSSDIKSELDNTLEREGFQIDDDKSIIIFENPFLTRNDVAFLADAGDFQLQGSVTEALKTSQPTVSDQIKDYAAATLKGTVLTGALLFSWVGGNYAARYAMDKVGPVIFGEVEWQIKKEQDFLGRELTTEEEQNLREWIQEQNALKQEREYRTDSEIRDQREKYLKFTQQVESGEISSEVAKRILNTEKISELTEETQTLLQGVTVSNLAQTNIEGYSLERSEDTELADIDPATNNIRFNMNTFNQMTEGLSVEEKNAALRTILAHEIAEKRSTEIFNTPFTGNLEFQTGTDSHLVASKIAKEYLNTQVDQESYQKIKEILNKAQKDSIEAQKSSGKETITEEYGSELGFIENGVFKKGEFIAIADNGNYLIYSDETMSEVAPKDLAIEFVEGGSIENFVDYLETNKNNELSIVAYEKDGLMHIRAAKDVTHLGMIESEGDVEFIRETLRDGNLVISSLLGEGEALPVYKENSPSKNQELSNNLKRFVETTIDQASVISDIEYETTSAETTQQVSQDIVIDGNVREDLSVFLNNLRSGQRVRFSVYEGEVGPMIVSSLTTTHAEMNTGKTNIADGYVFVNGDTKRIEIYNMEGTESAVELFEKIKEQSPELSKALAGTEVKVSSEAEPRLTFEEDFDTEIVYDTGFEKKIKSEEELVAEAMIALEQTSNFKPYNENKKQRIREEIKNQIIKDLNNRKSESELEGYKGKIGVVALTDQNRYVAIAASYFDNINSENIRLVTDNKLTNEFDGWNGFKIVALFNPLTGNTDIIFGSRTDILHHVDMLAELYSQQGDVEKAEELREFHDLSRIKKDSRSNKGYSELKNKVESLYSNAFGFQGRVKFNTDGSIQDIVFEEESGITDVQKMFNIESNEKAKEDIINKIDEQINNLKNEQKSSSEIQRQIDSLADQARERIDIC